MDIYEIAEELRAHRFAYASEVELHPALAATLAAAGAMHIQREVAIEGGRIDMIVDRVGIEVKIKGPTAEVRRQLTRYANGGDVEAILLVTTVSRHKQLASPTAYAVPVGVVHIA